MFARHKVEPDIAKGLGVENANLPVKSFGLVGGAHVYPVRRKVSLGLGVNIVLARGSRTLDVLGEDGVTITKSPTVRRHFTVPQIVELAATIAIEHFRAKFNTALGVQSQGLCFLPPSS